MRKRKNPVWRNIKVGERSKERKREGECNTGQRTRVLRKNASNREEYLETWKGF